MEIFFPDQPGAEKDGRIGSGSFLQFRDKSVGGVVGSVDYAIRDLGMVLIKILLQFPLMLFAHIILSADKDKAA